MALAVLGSTAVALRGAAEDSPEARRNVTPVTPTTSSARGLIIILQYLPLSNERGWFLVSTSFEVKRSPLSRSFEVLHLSATHHVRAPT